jgi:Holliday junction resolvase RusA-like endonuclease
MRVFEFFVEGDPKPAGSKSIGRNKKTNRMVIFDACKTSKKWKKAVKDTAVAKFGKPQMTGVVELEVYFFMPRPKSHLGTGKNSNLLRPSAPKHHLSKPDVTKLLRGTEDALSGVIWKDDDQIISQSCGKIYTLPEMPPGAFIRATVYTQEEKHGIVDSIERIRFSSTEL